MTALRVPRAPAHLDLRIGRHWNGTRCEDPRRHGLVSLSARPEGLSVRASLAHQAEPRLPAAPPGTRVANLYEYDVVECFLADTSGRYLEVELGAGGHFLVLEFGAPRRRLDDHLHLAPDLWFEPGAERWASTLVLPWSIVPPALEALNAFVIASGSFLAYHPVPGDAPDFHQPRSYPRATLSPGP